VSAQSLDQLLEQARVPEPDDDGFTDVVMQRIRTPRTVRRFRSRFVTRPVVIAAAAVLATGGALAAAVTGTTRITNSAQSTAKPAQTKAAPHAAASGPASSEKAGHTASTEPTVQASPATAAPKVVRTYHNAAYEWGYTSTHASYVLDKETGLRFAVDTRAMTVKAGRAHDVTVTLTNTTDKPVGISSQSGCAISVAAWRGSAGSGSVMPGTANDPSKAQVWTCADGTDARAGGNEEFLLGPGGVKTQTVRVTLPSGDWAASAVCRCDVVTSVNPGGGMTLHGLDSIVTGQAPTGGGSNLVTPLVAVKSG